MKANPSTEMGDGLLSLCWNNHRSTFCHVISTLREKERFSDVTLACEGRYYPVHKLVLSVCSDYFDSMLERTPCKHPVIVLRDVQPDDLEALLSYMYEGIVSVAQNDLARLIKTAEMLRIKGLAVPDDPVPSGGEPKRQSLGGNSQSPSRSGRESRERSSPSAKRRRKEDSGCSRESSQIQSTNDTTDISSLSPHDSYDANSNSRSRTNNREPSHIETKQEVMQSHDDIEEVIVPETLVKQEIEESDSIQKSDSSSLLGGYNVGDSSHIGSQQSDHSVLSHRYDDGAEQQHSQPLEEAVAEALAGPSGMQTWLGAGELNNSSFTTVDAYSTESGDVGGQQLGQQQMEFTLDGNGNRVCFCGFESKGRAAFRAHRLLHMSKSFKCPLCPYLSKTEQGVLCHKETMHSKKYNCPRCTFVAKRKVALNQHYIDVHRTCSICTLKCTSIKHLEEHLESHKAEKEHEEKENEAQPEVCIVEPDISLNEDGLDSSHEIKSEIPEFIVDNYDEDVHPLVAMLRSPQHEANPDDEDDEDLKENQSKGNLETAEGYMVVKHERRFKCPKCNYSCDRKLRLARHVKAHETNRTRRCPVCTFECISTNVMNAHVRKHDSVKFYSCSRVSCSFSCASREGLIDHENKHNGSKKLSCPECSFTSSSNNNLKKHFKEAHTGELKFSCDICSFNAGKPIHIKRHMLEKHGTGVSPPAKSHTCRFCPYKAAQASMIKQHERVHTGEKPYKCPICPYKGGQLSNLQYHMKNHQNEKAHICKFCPFAAISSNALTKHLQEHIGESMDDKVNKFAASLLNNDDESEFPIEIVGADGTVKNGVNENPQDSFEIDAMQVSVNDHNFDETDPLEPDPLDIKSID